METSNQFLGTERIGKLMKQYAVPCIVSLLVGALYNIVDQIFIANASYLGSYGNAANTVVFPLTVVALAIAVMIGDGCCAGLTFSARLSIMGGKVWRRWKVWIFRGCSQRRGCCCCCWCWDMC